MNIRLFRNLKKKLLSHIIMGIKEKTHKKFLSSFFFFLSNI